VYKTLGYTGIIVTDHFYNGNSCISRNLSWRKWVNRFCAGYEDAKAEGERQGLDVFFGWEETFDGDDYLVYGLDKEWLLDHPEAASWTRKEQFEIVHQYGGIVVQAHPFRQHFYIDQIHLSAACVDAVEVANANNAEQSFDALAKRYAERLGLPSTAGSDIHSVDQLKTDMVFGVYLDKKMHSIHDYVSAIGENRIQGIKIVPGRCDWRGNEKLRLPVTIRDREDQNSNQNFWEFLTTKWKEP
jgi:hypothetical protein